MKTAGVGLPARRRRALVLCIFAAAALPLLLPAATRAVEVPPGFQADIPIDAVHQPSGIAFAPETGQVFVAERVGQIKVFDGIDDPVPDLVLDIRENVHAFADRGMMGMALDPDYPSEPYVYVSYTRDARLGEEPPTHEENVEGTDSCVRLDSGELEEEGECVASGRVSRFELDLGALDEVTLGPEDEQPLITDWCQQYHSHSIDDLIFDGEGALLASGGDAASWAALDYGQFGNPCGDPEFEGGSLRSQDLRGRWNDPIGYNGTVIRIDPDTGEPMPSNTHNESDDPRARIVAYGLRNPFRLAIRPGTDELYVADVGSAHIDEVNRIPDLFARPNGWPVNFGWPCYEGPAVNPGFHALAFDLPLPICQSLYESPPVNLSQPFFSYPRGSELFDGDGCDPRSGSAVAGLTFFQLPATAQVGALPSSLHGALVIADAARGCVWTMSPGGDGRPSPSTLANLMTRDAEHAGFTPVNFAVGPDGALYMPDFWRNRIMRLRYFEGNEPPQARIAALPEPYGLMNGEGKFVVELDGSASSDAEDASGDLTYKWDLDGDGAFDQTTAEPTIEVEYDEPENVTAQLRVTDSEEATDVDRVKLYPGDRPPVGLTMTAPSAGLEWIVGEEIGMSGSATDPDAGDMVRLDWEVFLQHCPDHCHSHSHANVSGEDVSIVTPDHEYPSHLKVVLTARDSRGLASQTSIEREIHPKTVDVTLASVPAGVPLTIASTTAPAPFAERLLAAGNTTVSAPATAVVGGQQYSFAAWSDGGERTHLISRQEDDTLVAHYAPTSAIGGPQPPPLTLDAGPQRFRLRFLTRPRGLPLRVGRRWRRTPFARSLASGARPRVEAPKRLQRRGRLYVFARWMRGGRRTHRLVANRSRTYVAIFRSKPMRQRVRRSSHRRPGGSGSAP